MARITALLVVLALAGEPAANALCINWCDSWSETHDCDEAIAQPMVASVLDASTCAATLARPPFLREEGRGALHLDTVLHDVMIVSAPAQVTHVANVMRRAAASAGRPSLPLVLRV